jgi:nitrogen regulatory protein P-II 1
MKRIDAVIRREQFGNVKKSLDSIHCPGLMVFTFRGHGRQGGVTETYRGRKFKVDLLPKVLLTIFVNDPDVKKITRAIVKSAKTGEIGDGKIFVAPVENAIRIRTEEEGQAAL